MNKIQNKFDRLSIRLALEGRGFYSNKKRSELKFILGKYGTKLFSNYRKKPRPLLSTFAITNKCPWACSYCSRGMRAGTEDIPFETLKNTIEYLKKIGTPIYAFTGGEPLLRNDLSQILELIPSHYSAQIYTSGAGMTRELARLISNRGNVLNYISILSNDEKRNDLFKGREGALSTSKDAIETLSRAGAHAGVATVATKDLINEGIENFLVDLKKMGVQQVLIFEPKMTGGALSNPKWLISENEREYIASLHGLEKNRDDVPQVFSFPFVEGSCLLGCSAGYARVYVDALGNVCPCDFLPLSFGNINNEKFEDVWLRMNSKFPYPMRECFVNTYHEKINKALDGDLPLTEDASTKLCEDAYSEKHDYAGLYKNLGFSLEIATLTELGLI